jgi:hypothetical protein
MSRVVQPTPWPQPRLQAQARIRSVSAPGREMGRTEKAWPILAIVVPNLLEGMK